jgi:hypothetical protein
MSLVVTARKKGGKNGRKEQEERTGGKNRRKEREEWRSRRVKE